MLAVYGTLFLVLVLAGAVMVVGWLGTRARRSSLPEWVTRPAVRAAAYMNGDEQISLRPGR